MSLSTPPNGFGRQENGGDRVRLHAPSGSCRRHCSAKSRQEAWLEPMPSRSSRGRLVFGTGRSFRQRETLPGSTTPGANEPSSRPPWQVTRARFHTSSPVRRTSSDIRCRAPSHLRRTMRCASSTKPMPCVHSVSGAGCRCTTSAFLALAIATRWFALGASPSPSACSRWGPTPTWAWWSQRRCAACAPAWVAQ